MKKTNQIPKAQSSDLCDEIPIRSQKLSSQFHRINNQSVLAHRLLSPGTTNVRRPIVKNQIESFDAVLFEHLLDLGPALGPRDILLDRDAAADGLDGDEIDPEDEAADGDLLEGDLHPTTGGGAEIEDGSGFVEEGVLVVELDELVGGTGAEAALLGELVVLIQTMLSFELTLTHCCVRVLFVFFRVEFWL